MILLNDYTNLYYKFKDKISPIDLQKKYKELKENQNFIELVQNLWNEHCFKIYSNLKNENKHVKDIDYYNAIKIALQKEQKNLFTYFEIYFIENEEVYIKIYCDVKEILDYIIDFFKLEEFAFNDRCTAEDLNISDSEFLKRKLIKELFISGMIANLIYYENYKFDWFPSFNKLNKLNY